MFKEQIQQSYLNINTINEDCEDFEYNLKSIGEIMDEELNKNNTFSIVKCNDNTKGFEKFLNKKYLELTEKEKDIFINEVIDFVINNNINVWTTYSNAKHIFNDLIGYSDDKLYNKFIYELTKKLNI